MLAIGHGMASTFRRRHCAALLVGYLEPDDDVWLRLQPGSEIQMPFSS
jgi:hypothetical protein